MSHEFSWLRIDEVTSEGGGKGDDAHRGKRDTGGAVPFRFSGFFSEFFIRKVGNIAGLPLDAWIMTRWTLGLDPLLDPSPHSP